MMSKPTRKVNWSHVFIYAAVGGLIGWLLPYFPDLAPHGGPTIISYNPDPAILQAMVLLGIIGGMAVGLLENFFENPFGLTGRKDWKNTSLTWWQWALIIGAVLALIYLR